MSVKETTVDSKVETLDINLDEIFDAAPSGGDITLPNETKSKPNTAMFKENKFSDLLNETANDGQWRNMSGTPNGMFGADMAQAFGGNGQVNTSMIPQTDSDGRTTEMQKVVDSGVADALTRDYSGLMKAINKKKSGLL